ncbi:hypothetical protein LOZ57_000489 [Ophidiomyces ophidiicola]|uniref:uncharacterized protein n=1 Tax=Ophidiomyces ophidiicola TaxID=1387563 RepID=UPI0020C5A253|nr:uncharacterized protein LOZ57_000489 [Ophidiomyces ophidiicola]KAI1954139.1 hypothetical protein LOZ57_000489 [Ophidiomyces ophidiicola]KAI2052403.1 hypothetical protein LOZ43_004524 [Ophidiomyces ophidiicola]
MMKPACLLLAFAAAACATELPVEDRACWDRFELWNKNCALLATTRTKVCTKTVTPTGITDCSSFTTQTVEHTATITLDPGHTVTATETQTAVQTDYHTVTAIQTEIATVTGTQFQTEIQTVTNTHTDLQTVTNLQTDYQTVTNVETVTDVKTNFETITNIQTVVDLQTVTDIRTNFETVTALQTVTDVQTVTNIQTNVETITAMQTVTDHETVTNVQTQTVTQTAAVNQACATSTGLNIVANPGFEVSGSWVFMPASSDSDVEIAAGGGQEGARYLRMRTPGTSSNLGQNVLQSISVCPGRSYKLTFWYKRATSAGTITVRAYLGSIVVFSGTATSSTWVEGQGVWTAPNGLDSAMLRFEAAFSGGVGSSKEVNLDNVKVVATS